MSEIEQLKKEINELRGLIIDIDANMRRAWIDRSLSHKAWPVDLAGRVTREAAKAAAIEQR